MRKLAPKLLTLLSLALATAFVTPMRALADEEDPPTRVARLSHTDGNVSFNPAGTDDWVSAVINRPMTTGDKLWSDDGGRAELHIGSASLRIGGTGMALATMRQICDEFLATRPDVGKSCCRVCS